MQSHPSTPKLLTAQQLRFIEEYCKCWKGAPAARAAGYAEARAKQTARDLLRDPRIQAAIKERAEQLTMTTGEATVRLTKWGRVGIEAVMSREVVEHTPRIQKPLAQLVEEKQQYMDFEQRVAIATEALLQGKEQTKYRKRQATMHHQRKVELVRLQMQLEENSTAIVWVNGQTVAREVAYLDLVKVLDANAGGLIKKITPNKYGTAVELHDAKDAVDKILKLHGAYAPQKIDLRNLTDEQLNEMLLKAIQNAS